MKADKKEISCFIFNYVKKGAPNWPMADKGGYYIFNLMLMKNELQIGRRPTKRNLILNI